MTRVARLALLAGLLTLAACERMEGPGFSMNPFVAKPAPPPARPLTREEALNRVNENLDRLDQPLQCSALVSFSFRDESGRMRRFLGQEAALFFARPRLLRFDVRSPVGVIAQFGSSEQRYWLWIEPELQTLWWGDWRRASQTAQRTLPVPPNQLLDALMLRPLPETLDGRLRPTLRVEPEDTRLVFVRLGPDRQPTGVREVRLDAKPPYQPIEVVDRSAEGEVVMHARLFDYRQVPDSSAYTPRRYEVRWPAQEAELRMDITRATFRPDLTEDVFQFPSAWGGRVERIDQDAPRPVRDAAGRRPQDEEYPWSRPRVAPPEAAAPAESVDEVWAEEPRAAPAARSRPPRARPPAPLEPPPEDESAPPASPSPPAEDADAPAPPPPAPE